MKKAKGDINGKTISWLGDGNNNMSNSLGGGGWKV